MLQGLTREPLLIRLPDFWQGRLQPPTLPGVWASHAIDGRAAPAHASRRPVDVVIGLSRELKVECANGFVLLQAPTPSSGCRTASSWTTSARSSPSAGTTHGSPLRQPWTSAAEAAQPSLDSSRKQVGDQPAKSGIDTLHEQPIGLKAEALTCSDWLHRHVLSVPPPDVTCPALPANLE